MLQTFKREIYKFSETESSVVDCSRGIDVMFFLDYTGSMGSAINEVKSGIVDICSKLSLVAGGDDKYAVGIMLYDEANKDSLKYVNYIDKPAYKKLSVLNRYISHIGSPDDPTEYNVAKIFTVLENLNYRNSGNLNRLKEALRPLNTPAFPIGYGENSPEPLDVAIEKFLLEGFGGGFDSPERNKYIVAITDNTMGGLYENHNSDVIQRLDRLKRIMEERKIKPIFFSTSGVEGNLAWFVKSFPKGKARYIHTSVSEMSNNIVEFFSTECE